MAPADKNTKNNFQNRHDLPCPVCIAPLTLKNGVLLCPNKHGVLLTARQLSDAKREKKHALQQIETPAPDSQHPLACPHCGSQMHKVNYNDMEIIIDTCRNCQYRWLDAGELDRIVHHKPNMAPEDLLFLGDLDHKIKALQNAKPVDNNPRSPLHMDIFGGLMRGYAARDSRKMFALMAGVGFGGLIKGMVHSKFMRVFGVIFLIVFGVICYFLWKALTQIDFPQLYNGR